MTIAEIRAWAERTGKANRQEHRTAALMATFFVVMASLTLWRSSSINERIAYGIAILWLIGGQYHTFFVRRPQRLPSDAGLSTTLVFLRSELLRKRDQIRLAWLRGLGPIFLVIGTFLVPRLAPALQNPTYLKDAAPFLLLLSAWAVMYGVQRASKTRQMRAELSELEGLEREASTTPHP
jgi:hypothetical protein